MQDERDELFPAFQGGQGRSGDDVRADASGVLWMLGGIAVGALLLWGTIELWEAVSTWL